MLSVILPVYNASKTINKTLISIINQDINDVNIELIIINDGSTDKSASLINEFIKENSSFDITYIYKNNGGVSSARNLGIQKAKYEWIAFIDSDDVWCENKISKQFQVINNSKFNIDLIGCSRNKEVLKILGKNINYLYKANYKELLIKMFPQTSTVIVRKNVLDDIGGYDESMSHSEDGDLWIRICYKYDFYYMPDSLVITGDNKHNFGESGLSANLLAMEKGVHYSLFKLLKEKKINFVFFVFIKAFVSLKYIRRLCIQFYNKNFRN